MAKSISGRVWRERYERWKGSGLSLADFAEREKVKPGSWTWWVRRMEEFDREASSRMTFVRVADGELSGQSTARDIEVTLPNDVRLRVPCGAPLGEISVLVAALSELRFR